MASTTAQLLASLDIIHLELSKMQHAIDDSAGVPTESRRSIKAALHLLRAEADRLSYWLGEARLETPAN